jgi:hypothetical protein
VCWWCDSDDEEEDERELQEGEFAAMLGELFCNSKGGVACFLRRGLVLCAAGGRLTVKMRMRISRSCRKGSLLLSLVSWLSSMMFVWLCAQLRQSLNRAEPQKIARE